MMPGETKLSVKQVMLKYGTIIILLVMCVALSLISPNFLKTRNLLNIMKQISIYVIIGFGVTFVIITGGIDLSSGALVAVSSMIVGSLIIKAGWPWPLACLMTMLAGAVVGCLNGSLVAFFHLPPFLATLGTKLALLGTALFIQDKPIHGFSESFKMLGQGSWFGIPILVYFMLVVGLFSHYLLAHTKFGRYTYAIGGNAEAARVSGIDIKRTTVLVYAYASMLAALAGVLMTSRIMTASPNNGDGFELEAITGAAIGGISMAGGVGTITGTLIGALIAGVLNNGLDLMLVGAYAQQILKGFIIIAAVILDQMRNKHRR